MKMILHLIENFFIWREMKVVHRVPKSQRSILLPQVEFYILVCLNFPFDSFQEKCQDTCVRQINLTRALMATSENFHYERQRWTQSDASS